MTRTSCGSPARPRESVRPLARTARGPTPRSSACRGASIPTTRPCGSTSPTWTPGTRSASTSPSGWRPSRASAPVFIHNALYFWGGRAYMGEGDPANNKDEIIANTVAPLVLGDMFIRAAQPAVDAGVDCGLVQISSASARIVYPGLAIYGASKAAMEQWVRAVRAEREDRGKGPWVSAIRPGFVDTPAARRDAALPEDTYPGVAGIAEAVRTGNFLSRRRVGREHLELDPRSVHRQAGAAVRRGGRRHHLILLAPLACVIGGSAAPKRCHALSSSANDDVVEDDGMADSEILIRGWRGRRRHRRTGRAGRRARARRAASSRSAPTSRRDGEREIDAVGRGRHARLHRHPRATPIRRCSGTRRSIPIRCTASPRCSSATAACRSTPSTERRAATISDLFAYIEDVPRHLFDDSVPWTWTDYAGYRDAVERDGHRHQPRRARRPQPDPARGDGRRRAGPAPRPPTSARRWPRCSTTRWTPARGASPTSFLDVDQHGRPVPSRAADGAEFDALFDVIERGRSRRRRVRARPARPDPEVALEDLGPSLRRARHPAHVDGLRRTPTATRPSRSGGSTSPASSPRKASRMYPQLSPRTVDFRLNWDSSMMFMSMPEGWHRVIAARGDDKPALLRDPEWRAAARDEWDRTEMAHVPPSAASRWCASSRSSAPRTSAGSAAPCRARRRARRPSVRRASPTSCSANDCRPGRRRGRASPTPTSTAWPRTLADPAVLISSSDCRRARADAVRVGRHHAAAHPPRARARRLHARAGGLRAHRPPGRRVRLPPAAA